MRSKSLVHSTIAGSMAFVYLTVKYLRDLRMAVGVDSYLKSPIRLEHGTGTGFAGIGNTGSLDTAKERFRRVTDGMGLSYRSWNKIPFRSESCLQDLVISSNPDFKNIYRVEHTREVIDLYKLVEQLHIIGDEPFTVNSLSRWFVENQLVCLITASEQKRKSEYDIFYPFSKYSSKVYYKNTDVTSYNLNELKALNTVIWKDLLSNIDSYDFSSVILAEKEKRFINNSKNTRCQILILL